MKTYNRDDLMVYMGRRMQFRVVGNPNVYRGTLVECDDKGFKLTCPLDYPITCDYVDIAPGSLIGLVTV